MPFEGNGHPLTHEGLARVCATLASSEPIVWAVLSVETSGFGFLQDRRLQILFERHIFHRRTGGRFDAGHEDISNQTRGGYAFGAGEYPRLERALALDEAAALESTSWGVGQVMGFNHKTAGFETAQTMVDAMLDGEDAQLLAVANFIKGTNLASALQNQDWAAFALGYNGPAFADNKYDERLREAHAKCQGALPDLGLRSAQAALLYLRLEPGSVDGFMGNRTRAALIKFQEGAGLPQTGDLDPTTKDRLLAQAFPGLVTG